MEAVLTMGGKYCTKVEQNTDYVIARHAEGREYKLALEWSIPVVSRDWLIDMYCNGGKPHTYLKFT